MIRRKPYSCQSDFARDSQPLDNVLRLLSESWKAEGKGFLSIIELGLLSVALGSDAFSVAICVGLAGATAKERLRLASGFGGFQFLMPIIGLYIGHFFGRQHIFGRDVDEFAVYVGGGLLVFLGVMMIVRTAREGFHCPPFIHTSFFALLGASLGVSIDALAVGFSLGVLRAKLLLTVSVIGVVAFLMTIAGLEVGNQIGKVVQNRAAVLGGIILVAVGLKILAAG